MDDHDLLSLAVRLVQQAGVLIMSVRARGFDVGHKTDDSPVTEADHAAERLIVAGLRAACPEIPVIAEEEVAAGRLTRTCPMFWLVDPLDGTREFSQGREEFTCNIGLVRDGCAVLGAVGVPACGELFAGIVGGEAWKLDAAGRRPIRVRATPPEGVTVVASRHHGDDPQLGVFLRDYRVAAVRNMGSAVKFCRVAEGAADLYPRLGRTMEWDSAAPQAVVEAAGGRVVLLDGAPLRYGKPGWENPDFVCVGGRE